MDLSMTHYLFQTSKLFVIAMLIAIVSGCATSSEEDCSFLFYSWCHYDDITVDDSTRFGSVEIHLPEAEGLDKHVRLRYTAIADVAMHQVVPSNNLIAINGDEIWGSAEIDNEAELQYMSISYGSERWTRPDETEAIKYGFLGYLGMSLTDFKVTTKLEEQNYLGTEITTYVVDDKTVELYGQLGLLVSPLQDLDIGITYSLSIGEYVSGMSEMDLFLRYRLHKNIGIQAGYRKIEYLYQGLGDYSDVSIEADGPAIGLNLFF